MDIDAIHVFHSAMPEDVIGLVRFTDKLQSHRNHKAERTCIGCCEEMVHSIQAYHPLCRSCIVRSNEDAQTVVEGKKENIVDSASSID